MNLIYYVLGVGFIFLTKLLVNNKADEPVEKWKRIFEIPADLTMLAFMMGVAGTASLTSYSRENQIVLIIIITLSVLSVAVFKQNCRSVSAKGGITQFDTYQSAIAWFVLNSIIATLTVILSYSFLGANES